MVIVMCPNTAQVPSVFCSHSVGTNGFQQETRLIAPQIVLCPPRQSAELPMELVIWLKTARESRLIVQLILSYRLRSSVISLSESATHKKLAQVSLVFF